jgi:nucleotide-binding universal stress UspA family protein
MRQSPTNDHKGRATQVFLVATDGSEGGTAALRKAADLAATENAELVVLAVYRRDTESGEDRATGTRLHFTAKYRVGEEGPHASLVELSVDYVLRGLLAQLGRADVIKVFATDLIEEAARNLEARLAGLAPTRRPFGIGRSIVKLASMRIARLLRWAKFQGRDGP